MHYRTTDKQVKRAKEVEKTLFAGRESYYYMYDKSLVNILKRKNTFLENNPFWEIEKREHTYKGELRIVFKK